MQTIMPNKSGRYGKFGGCYMPEGLMAPIKELQEAFMQACQNSEFCLEFNTLLTEYAGRPTPLTLVENFSHAIDGPMIALKREDLLHTGAHKINNALGQCLLAKQLGKKRVIAETGAGQHGVATATACAKLGLQCVVYMGVADMQRQAPNVQRMQLLGAEVVPVKEGSCTLKDAVNEALRDWAISYEQTHYCLGSALGPHPYPAMVAFFQSIIGREAKQQCADQFQRLPDMIIACVGGGSNAIGIFSDFIADTDVDLIGVEAGGFGRELGAHAARMQDLRAGVLHGCYTYLLQDVNGQIASTHSVSAGLDYPAVGPQHAALQNSGRVHYSSVTDAEALAAFKLLSRTEGIIPALESSHALAYIKRIAATLPKDKLVIVNLSGRGDKDLAYAMELLDERKKA